MPIVPFGRQPAPQAQAPQIEPIYLAMAAAMMAKEGKLFKPEEAPSEMGATVKDKA